jgi:hypothetical protein
MQSITTMETLLEKEKSTTSIPENGIITFCAFRPRTQMSVTCRPTQDKSGKLWTGQGTYGYYELLTEDDKRKLPFIFDHETKVVIEDGKTLNLDDPFDAALWKWLQKHPYIAIDKSLGGRDRDKVYYVANERKEAKERIDKSAKIDEARPAVRKLSQADQVRIAKALGLESAAVFSPEQILDWLLNKATTNPEAVLAVIDPANKARTNAAVFVKEIVKWKVIERERDGVFYFGGINGVTLGHSEDMVVTYLIDPQNAERVRAMKAMLAEKTKTKVD